MTIKIKEGKITLDSSLVNTLQSIDDKLFCLMEALGIGVMVTTKEIACYYRVSVEMLKKKPYMMPRFGRPDTTTGKVRKWYRSTWNQWKNVSLEERKSEWELLTSKEKKTILGF